MHHDVSCRSLLYLLYLRWLVGGRAQQPDDATFPEIARCLDLDRVVLIDLLEALMTAGFIDPVRVEHRGSDRMAYRISDTGRHVVLADRNAQRRMAFDA